MAGLKGVTVIRPVQKDLYAVIGNPVKHSLSPVMMNAVFKKLGIPALYLALELDDLAADLKTLAQMSLKGLSITIPHKETAFLLADSVDDSARAIGAVNTYRLMDGGWEAINTDWLGVIGAIGGSLRAFEGKRALVLGAGGVARAAAFAMKQAQASLTIANRGIDRGKALAEAFNGRFLPLQELQNLEEGFEFDAIIQCTSVGLAPGDSSRILPNRFFRPHMVVLDTVYRPLWTPFLVGARDAGCRVIPGAEMLIHQGLAQLRWWLGDRISTERALPIMREAVMEVLQHE